ncbi:hypothetical protein ABS772_08795 [Methylorubrum podarium]|uniref:Uncharacterized protein n=1 Tax=Methylorubrum podarium TaxID=200476 RepID=A0ABV1QKU0_9HYPH
MLKPKPPKNLKKLPGADKARGGRPTLEDALRRKIAAVGVDPVLVDPRRVLAGIAVDEQAPATARVAAARALLASQAGLPPLVYVDPDEVPEEDVVTRRALAVLTAGRPN